MPDEHGATWIPDGNYFPNRDGNKPRYIVLHGTAGGTSAVGIGDYFKSTEGGSNPVSAHYVVGLQGEVVQCVNESDGAWSNGVITGASGVAGNGVGNGFHDSWWNSGVNPNLLTVAIEHVKSATDNSTQLTDAQKQASFTLVAHICQRHAIPMRKADAHGGITGHYAIDPVNRARCPGPYPWDELFAFLGQGGGEEQVVLNIQQVANYFVEDTQEQRWYLKLPDTSNHNNNHFIGGDILKYYRTCTNIALNGFSQYGLPLAHEERVPNTKQATTQRFERGVILFDPMKEVDSVPGLPGPCYPSHIDSGPGEDPRIAQLEAELAALQKQPVAPSAPAITPIISATPIAAATSMVPTPAPAAAAPMVPAPTPAAAATPAPAPAPQTPSPTTQPFPQQPIPVSQMVVNAVKRDVLSPIKRLFSGS